MSGRTKCILIVDDDVTIRETVADTLMYAGYLVEMANSGIQALAKVRTTRPDAIVLDLSMPVMDGWTFLDELRSDPLGVASPVAIMSCLPRLQEISTTLHVEGFVTKPFDLYDFLHTIDRLTQTPTEVVPEQPAR